MIRELISALVEGRDLTQDEAAQAMGEMMEGEATPAQIAAFITALRIKGETVEETALREVREETGLEVEPGDLIGLFSEPGNPVMVAVYAARETGGSLAAGTEALELGFFDVDDLPELAFPRDREVLATWRERAGPSD